MSDSLGFFNTIFVSQFTWRPLPTCIKKCASLHPKFSRFNINICFTNFSPDSSIIKIKLVRTCWNHQYLMPKASQRRLDNIENSYDIWGLSWSMPNTLVLTFFSKSIDKLKQLISCHNILMFIKDLLWNLPCSLCTSIRKVLKSKKWIKEKLS
jgi:hypothetical protein